MQGNFNQATRFFTQTMTPMTYQASSTVSADLPQTGFLAAIDLVFTGTITTAGSSSTTNLVYPAVPFGLVKRIKLSTNEGADIWNTSAWGAYVYNATLRTGLDQLTNHSDYLGSGFTDPFASYGNYPASLGASATFNFAFPVRLQISWAEALMSGLVLLQNPGVRFTLSIDWGSTADLWSATTGTVTLTNVQVIPALELFLVPSDQNDYPDLSFAKTVLEDTKTISAAGTFTYEPPRGNTYTRIVQEFVNGPTTAYVPMGYDKVTNFSTVYAQTQNINTDRVENKLFRARRLYGRDLPTGVYVHEFSCGLGIPELPNTRDNLDTSQITDFQINSTIASGTTITAGAFCRTVKEQLVVVRG